MTNGTAERVFNGLGMRQAAYGKPDVGVYQGRRKTRAGDLLLTGSAGKDVLIFSAELGPRHPYEEPVNTSVEIIYSSDMKPGEVARRIAEGIKTDNPSDRRRELQQECITILREI